MFWMASLRSRFRALFRHRQFQADLDSEFRDHWEQEVEQNLRAGIPPEEAKRAAQRLMGPMSRYQEECRDVRGIRFLENLLRDLRYAWRGMRKNAAFSLIAILALALEIGASTAIYNLARTVVFAPLPFSNADRLVQIQNVSRKTGQPNPEVSYADLSDWKMLNHTLTIIGGYGFALLDLSGDSPAALYGARVTHDLFTALGVKPSLGRSFLPREDQPGHGQEIILSDDLWRSRFGADPHLVGKSIRLVGQPETDEYVVVGIMPPGFNFPLTIPTAVNPPTRQMAYWIPVAKQPSRRVPIYLTPVGLLRPGISLPQAQADLVSVAAQLERQYPDTNTGSTIRLVALKDEILGRSKVALSLLLGAIGTILAVIWVNLAHLLLSSVLSRTQESGVRLALGASRFRLAQQWMVEGFLLSSIGSLGALVIARVSLRILLQIAPQAIPRIAETRIDAPALIFTGLAALLAGLTIGCLPAWAAARTDVQTALSSAGTRTTAQPGRARTRDVLIVAEVSLAVVLALGAGLLVKSFSRLTSVDPGFSRDHVATALILLIDRRYPDLPSRTTFMHKLLEELKNKPGILAAGVVDGTPLSGNIGYSPVRINGQSSSERGANRPAAEIFSVSAAYLSAIGIRLQQGRYLNEQDAHNRIAIINATAAKNFWPNQNPLGKRIRIENGFAEPQERTVAGIVSDTRDVNIDQPVLPALYIPMEEGVAPPQMLVARLRDDVSNTTAAQTIRQAVATLDKNQPVFLVTSMEDLYNNSIAERRFTTFLLTVLGALALVLAALGVYGVISYSAAQRTKEIGIRTALGAQRGQIVWLVLSRGLVLSFAGTAIGIAIGLFLTRYMAGLLYEVAPNDLTTLTTVVLLITGVSVLAGLLPSFRAVRIDPVRALRQD